MCDALGFPQNWWSISGLIADLSGVALLGVDLVRIQQSIRRHARVKVKTLTDISDEYGGIDAWAEEIKKYSKWVPEQFYSEYHAEDETSYNARRSVENVEKMADCVSGLAEHLSQLTLLQEEYSKSDLEMSTISLRFSLIGLTLICVGFGFQVVGAWPC